MRECLKNIRKDHTPVIDKSEATHNRRRDGVREALNAAKKPSKTRREGRGNSARPGIESRKERKQSRGRENGKTK